MTQTTARQWIEAKERGERLKAHELPCELCGKPVTVSPLTHPFFDATDTFACDECVEALLEDAFEATDDTRSEVGLVGGGH